MSWEVVPLDGGLGQHRADWDRLNGELYRGHPYFDSHFVEPLLRYFSTGRERLCIHTINGAVDGMLIAVPRRLGLWSLFVPAQAQVAPVLVKEIGDLSKLFQCLGGNVLGLEFPCQDPLFSPFSHDPGDWPLVRDGHALTISVKLAQPFVDYWGTRSKNLQKNYKRYLRKVEESGMRLRREQVCAAAQMRDAVARYGRLESKGWKGQIGTAVHPDNAQGRFYADLLEGFAVAGKAFVYELYCDDSLVASRLCVAGPEMFVILKTTYEEEFAQLAPGRLLLHAVLEKEFENRRFKSIEFYTDANRDQISWSTDQRRIYHITLFRNDVLRRAYVARRALLGLRAGAASASWRGTATDQRAVWKVNRFRGLNDLPLHVAALFDNAESLSFDLSLEWFQLLVDTTLAEADEIHVYAVEAEGNGKARLVLPLQSRRKGRHLAALSNFYTSLYAPVTGDHNTRDAFAACFEAIRDESPAWASLRLQPLDYESSVYGQIKATLRSSGWLTFEYFCFGNWFLPVHDRSYDECFARLPSRTRHTVERKRRQFLSPGIGSLKIVTANEDLDAAIRDYEKVYAASWKAPEPYPRFIPTLLRLYASRGALRLGLAHCKGEPAASQIWIVHHGRAAIYKLAYDARFEQYSVGSILTDHLMRHVIDVDRVREVDYLIGDDVYKRDWMSRRRERWGILAYNPRTARGLAGAADQYLRHTAKCVFRTLGLTGRSHRNLSSKQTTSDD